MIFRGEGEWESLVVKKSVFSQSFQNIKMSFTCLPIVFVNKDGELHMNPI